MPGLDEFAALTRAIGEYTVEALGKENLSALQVVAHPREFSAFVEIALEDRSDAAQRRAIEVMFEVEQVYWDEIALTYVFVDQIEDTDDVEASQLQYSYA
ncbi:hypothetical protein ACPPVW_17490 [Leifsonia sp. McL0607]|uniref:hypothetical protein n=1 Tax=Leifsonia sp. McL0607 TaxID=3415672 RepID=UPI003CF54B8D